VLKLLRTPFAWFLRPQASSRSSRPPAETGPGGPELTPEAPSRLAGVAVQMAALAHQIELDYSPASLDKVESLILGAKADVEAGAGASADESLHQMLLVFGCYVGEVLVRHLDFSWDAASPAERGLSGITFGLRGPNGGFWNPIGRLYRLAANGAEDSIAAMYQMARDTAARSIPAVLS
jgi:hypothetical protein